MLKTKIFNIIKQAFYKEADVDDSDFPKGIAVFAGKTSRFIRMSVYGICSNPTSGSHIILLNAQGRESSRFGFINDFLDRKKDLKEGEVALFNSKTGTYIYLKEDGSIEVNSDFNITGDLIVDGDIDATGDVVADGISLKNHTHNITHWPDGPGGTESPTP